MQGYQRHRWFYIIVRRLVYFPIRWLLRYEPAPAVKLPDPYIVIANHTTDYDSILLSLSFPKQMYYIASEHIFRIGWLRKPLVYFLDPIAKRKGGADIATAMQAVRRLRQGRNIALFAEGNKSFHGATCPVHPATGSLVKASKATLVTLRLEGGYFTSPRWAHTLRRGRMRGVVVGIYPPEEIAAMPEADINRLIARDIDENAYRRQSERPVNFRGRKLAEGIQNALYRCPKCLRYGTVHGEEDQIVCDCGLRLTYTQTGMLEGAGAPFRTLEDWGAWQRAAMREQWLTCGDASLFTDECQAIVLIHTDHHVKTVAEGTLSISRQGLICGSFHLPLSELQGLEIYGRNTIVFSDGDGNRYQVRSAVERSGLKYFEANELLHERSE